MYRQPCDEEDVVMSVEWHEDVAEIGDEWEALAERTDAPPFAYPGWFGAWYEAFGQGPQMLALRRDGRLAAVVPLDRRAGVVRSAANWHTPLFPPPAEPEALPEVAEALLGRRARRIDLTMLDPADPLLALLRSPGCIERVVARQPWVDTTGPWDGYEATLARKMRKELRRQRRRLEEQGEVCFEFTAGGERLDALLSEGFRVEGSGWKAERGTAIASDPALDAFYRTIARWADGRGWLKLAFLRVNGRAVAFDMHVETGGAAYVLKGGFDPEWARFSPGSVLTHGSLERAFEEPSLSAYEFVGSDDAYKLTWSNVTRERVRLQSFGRTPGGLVERLAWTRGRPLAKRAIELARR
jgi:CelD/BcsL family acetyltransferase involved in cellulose biosynthesis